MNKITKGKTGRPRLFENPRTLVVTMDAADLDRLDAYMDKHGIVKRSAGVRRLIEQAKI